MPCDALAQPRSSTQTPPPKQLGEEGLGSGAVLCSDAAALCGSLSERPGAAVAETKNNPLGSPVERAEETRGDGGRQGRGGKKTGESHQMEGCVTRIPRGKLRR